MATKLADLSIRGFQERLAGPDPTPGGGCAAALAAMNGAALAAMVARLTAAKEKFAAVRPLMAEIEAEAVAASEAFRDDLEADAASYDAVAEAMKMPKGTDEEKRLRKGAIEEGLRGATEVPRRVAHRCLDLLESLPDLAREGNPNAASDVGVAGLMLYAALRGALLNVDTNLAGLSDGAYVAELRKEEATLLERGGRLSAEIEREVRQRI